MRESQYWERRKNSIYLRFVDYIVSSVGANAASLIDIGSRDCAYFSWFPWIEERVSLDLKAPYVGDGVRSIVADFFAWQPDKRYDVALCLQVLEHIEDAATFSRKLVDLADHVIVSVPYKWRPGSVTTHVQDPIDINKFNSWFPIRPTYYSVVSEPFSRRNGRRIVAYFDTQEPESKRYMKARALARRRMSERERFTAMRGAV